MSKLINKRKMQILDRSRWFSNRKCQMLRLCPHLWLAFGDCVSSSPQAAVSIFLHRAPRRFTYRPFQSPFQSLHPSSSRGYQPAPTLNRHDQASSSVYLMLMAELWRISAGETRARLHCGVSLPPSPIHRDFHIDVL